MWQPGLVLALKTLYWGCAVAKAVHLRRTTGRSSQPWPKNRVERLLIVAWIVDIAVWVGQPVLLVNQVVLPGMEPIWHSTAVEAAGAALGLAGLALSILAWVQMGASWRLGTTHKERTDLVVHGLFAWVRHPIYASQAWLLLGSALLLPTPVSAGLTVVHMACLLAKARLEERFLVGMHGDDYVRYARRVGGFFPRLLPAPAVDAGTDRVG